MKLFSRFGTAAVLAVLSSCGVGDDSASRHQALAVSCPAGQVPWDFYRFKNGLDDESLRQLGPDAGSGDPLVGEPNYFILKKAECTRPGATAPIDLTAELQKFSPPRRNKPQLPNEYWNTYTGARGRCGGSRIATTYTCFEDQQDLTATDFTDAKCPSRPIERTVCVPENCYGRTRRGRDLDCVPDVIKQVEPKDQLKVHLDVIERPLQDPSRPSPDAYTLNAGQSVLILDNDQMYRFAGSLDTTSSTPPQQLLSLWMKSVITRPGTAQSVDMFRCFVGRVDLRKYQPVAAGSGWRVAFDETFRIPPECKDGANFSKQAKTALLANGHDVPDAQLPTSASSTILMASYDLEGNAILTTATTPIESTCAPNPVDFFFNYATKVHNGFDYYSQTTIPVAHRRRSPNATPEITFNAAPLNLVAALSVEVPLLEYKVNKAGRARGSIDSTVVVALSGPESGAWARFLQVYTNSEAFTRTSWVDEYPHPPFPGNRDVVTTGRRLSLSGVDFLNPAGTATALVPVPNLSDLGSDGQPRPDYSGMIVLPEESLGLKFDGAVSETGAGAQLRVKLNNTIRTALFNPGGRYPLRPGESRNYVLQVCANNKVRESFEVTIRKFWNVRNAEGYLEPRSSVDKYTKHVAVAPASPRPGFGGKFDPYDANVIPDGQASSLTTARNNCSRSAVFSFKGENIVTPLPEVDSGDGDLTDLNPTSNGDENRLQATFNSDTTQDCVGSRCESTTEQSLGGTNAPIRTTVLSIVNEQTTDDTTNQFQTTFKMFGFDVLEAVENGSVGPVETTLAINPNYEAIARAFNKPYPAFKIEAGRAAAGVNGLSVGFEYKVPVRYGPLQGDLIFGVGAGAGINVEVSHTYNPTVATTCAAVLTDGGVLPNNCPDPMVPMPAMTFREARDLCFFLGGRLAEPRSDAVESAMRQKIGAASEVWIGAQVGNEYKERTDCAQTWNSSVCSPGHNTYLRWLSDAENFRKSSSFGSFANDGASPVTTLSGSTLSTETLLAGRPVDSAVTLQNSTFRVRPMDGVYPALCRRPLITSGTSHEVGIKLNVGFGAGFSVAFCVPSDELGVCLQGSMNIIEAKLTPGVSVIHTALTNNAGARATQTKLGAKVGWSVNLLSGALEISLVSPFGSLSYTLLAYEGFKVGEGTLAEFEYDLNGFPVGF